jgi:ATP-dependent helicase/nuclease subunit A
VRLHALLERLPAVAPAGRKSAADLWLQSAAGVASAEERTELVTSAMGVIEHPDFAPIFGPNALAEVPVTGVVDGTVIAGTVDRLLITETEIHVVDFKTGRRVPSSVAQVSDHHKAQMGAYAAVLSMIFPGMPVRAALLYTSGPRLIELDAETLARFKPGFAPPQQVLLPAS